MVEKQFVTSLLIRLDIKKFGDHVYACLKFENFTINAHCMSKMNEGCVTANCLRYTPSLKIIKTKL